MANDSELISFSTISRCVFHSFFASPFMTQFTVFLHLWLPTASSMNRLYSTEIVEKIGFAIVVRSLPWHRQFFSLLLVKLTDVSNLPMRLNSKKRYKKYGQYQHRNVSQYWRYQGVTFLWPVCFLQVYGSHAGWKSLKKGIEAYQHTL